MRVFAVGESFLLARLEETDLPAVGAARTTLALVSTGRDIDVAPDWPAGPTPLEDKAAPPAVPTARPAMLPIGPSNPNAIAGAEASTRGTVTPIKSFTLMMSSGPPPGRCGGIQLSAAAASGLPIGVALQRVLIGNRWISVELPGISTLSSRSKAVHLPFAKGTSPELASLVECPLRPPQVGSNLFYLDGHLARHDRSSSMKQPDARLV